MCVFVIDGKCLGWFCVVESVDDGGAGTRRSVRGELAYVDDCVANGLNDCGRGEVMVD